MPLKEVLLERPHTRIETGNCAVPPDRDRFERTAGRVLSDRLYAAYFLRCSQVRRSRTLRRTGSVHGLADCTSAVAESDLRDGAIDERELWWPVADVDVVDDRVVEVAQGRLKRLFVAQTR